MDNFFILPFTIDDESRIIVGSVFRQVILNRFPKNEDQKQS